MAEIDEKELLQHTVDIDEYTQITLNIPKKLHIEDLMGLVVKTKKLFSISEARIASDKRFRRSVDSIKAKSSDKKKGDRGHTIWNKEQEESLMKMRKAGKSWQDISNAVGIDVKRCEKHHYYIAKIKGGM